jgi:hypothetical protein
MSDAYVIELQGNAVGIIVRKHRNESQYKFLSALHAFNALEGQEFEGPLQAEIAAKKLLKASPFALSRGNSRDRF